VGKNRAFLVANTEGVKTSNSFKTWQTLEDIAVVADCENQ
jgi:hypothetical protein